LKIAIASDLHLEFGALEIENTQGADVLVLSGDILVANDLVQHDPFRIMGNSRSNRYHDFMESCCEKFSHVIYVMGNHEHYYGDFAKTIPHVKDMFGHLKNLHVLDKEMFVLDDVHFVGGTLWTDMNNEDPLTLYHMPTMMNDFRCVINSDRVVNYKTFDDINNPGKPTFRTREAKFSPEDAVAEFKNTVEYLKLMLETHRSKKFVMCGHHAPSRQSTHAMYAHDQVMNGGYSSNLEQFILDQENLVLWTHGHTHHNFDYTIDQCRVVCNPRGYHGHEVQAATWQLQTVEI
jgi:predicted phosphodiesterase